MVSARSTVSIARTTPAQKPRGEQSTIFRGGLAGIRRPRTGSALIVKGRGTVDSKGLIRPRTWDGFWALSRATHCVRAPGRLIRGAIPVIVDDYGFASRRWAKRKGDLP